MTALRLDRLELQNFRCFSRCDLDLHPRLTVLVADNGNGKTALLDAAALALSAYVSGVYPEEAPKRLDRNDVRLVPESTRMEPTLPTCVRASGFVADRPIQWESSVSKFGAKVRPTTASLKKVRAAASGLLNEQAVLPLVAFYGTGRLWGEQRLTRGRRTSITDVTERLTGYSDCLTSSSSFKGVSTWYDRRVRETAAPAFSEALQFNLALLAAVKEATSIVLGPTGWSALNWDRDLQALVAEHNSRGRLPVALLSDGVRNMLALVADVARRCASLNPQLGEEAARLTPGVLLIDEVDMHLHPRWQQTVIELLVRAFPALQIIVSTHSPHVLSTVDNSSIRVTRLVDGEAMITTPLLQTRGVESADVLASVMGVDPVPQVQEARDLSEYRAMIEDGKSGTSEAIELRTRLDKHFGEKHPVMVECERLIRFQKFRVKRDQQGGA